MKERMYLINELSEFTGVSKDTVRYYDKIGLLKPEYVDEVSNYRYYSYEQFWLLDVITCLRDLRIPIEEIKKILASKDNNKVLELLSEHQNEAKRLSNFYKRVYKDIDWYKDLAVKVDDMQFHTVEVKEFPERKVLFAETTAETRDYHLKVQKLCRETMGNLYSIRRSYGWAVDAKSIQKNTFIKNGEYVYFHEKVFREVPKNKMTVLPAGKYACCVVYVQDEYVDFSVLNQWLQENGVEPEFVIADEIGLSLFTYYNHRYPCEIKVLLK